MPQSFIVVTVYYDGTESTYYFDNLRTVQSSIDVTYSNLTTKPVAIYQGRERGTEWTLAGEIVARARDVAAHEIHTQPEHF
jgi:hypothetical protein